MGLPLLLYLYIPVRGLVTSSLDGSFVNTPQGLWSWITASSYSAFWQDNRELPYRWPRGMLSLSHVALPFPPDDPLYGAQRPADRNELFLGDIPI